VIHPVSPHYSTLLKFDPDNYPKVVGDLAESWTVSPDNLTFTFKLRDGVKFHDGSPLDVTRRQGELRPDHQAPAGVISARKQSYGAIDSVATPDPLTVVFKLKYVSPAMLSLFASPWNYIYSAAALDKDPKFPEKNILGSGPFHFRRVRAWFALGWHSALTRTLTRASPTWTASARCSSVTPPPRRPPSRANEPMLSSAASRHRRATIS